MTDQIANLLASTPPLRRLVWRVGRKLYALARNEQLKVDIAEDGETYLQACVLQRTQSEPALTVADIGANEGEWTVTLMKQYRDLSPHESCIKVHLFEPVPTTRERLRRKLLQANCVDLCTVHSQAMSDKAGSFQLAIMSESGGTNTLHFDNMATTPPGGWIDVQTNTFSAFAEAERITHFHLVKCDTEGNDLLVIRGAHELLSRSRIDVMQFEYNHRWIFSRSYLKDVFDEIRGLPYKLGKLVPKGIEVFDDWHPELDRFFQSNYVLVSEKALPWFNVRKGQFDASNTYA